MVCWGEWGRWLPTGLFVVFMLSWFASRMYYFPAYVIRSVYYEPINVRSRPLALSCAASACLIRTLSPLVFLNPAQSLPQPVHEPVTLDLCLAKQR